MNLNIADATFGSWNGDSGAPYHVNSLVVGHDDDSIHMGVKLLQFTVDVGSNKVVHVG